MCSAIARLLLYEATIVLEWFIYTYEGRHLYLIYNLTFFVVYLVKFVVRNWFIGRLGVGIHPPFQFVLQRHSSASRYEVFLRFVVQVRFGFVTKNP